MIYTVTLNPAVDRELTVKALEFDSVLRAIDWQVDFGGKGFNVSRMLLSLGTVSTALGFVGGRSGELLRDGLESLGIATEFIWVAGETRTNVSIVTDPRSHYLKVNEPGPEISPAEQGRLLAQVHDLAQAGDWWVLAGSLPRKVDPTFYAQLIQVIQSAGGRAILDTSGDALEAGCRAGAYLVKPNDVEAQKLTGMPVESDVQIVAAARAIQALGVDSVVVSLGKRGALLVDPAQAWLYASPKIQEQNPIGAGDSLVGGLVWGLAEGLDLPEALRWGVACGAATASQSGTAVGPRPLVEKLVAQVQARELVSP